MTEWVCWRAATLAALSFMAAGCSLILDSKRVQCSETLDCAEDETGVKNLVCEASRCIEPASEWYCVGAGPDEVDDAMVAMRFSTFDLQTQDPVKATARLCRGADINCVSPVGDTFVADSKGNLEVLLSSSFVGFIEVTTEEHLPALVTVDHPTGTEKVDNLALFTPETLEFLTGLLGITVDLTLGQAILRTRPCGTFEPAGVAYDISPTVPESMALYSQDGTPSLSAKVTDAVGQVLLLNLPVGAIGLKASVPGDGKNPIELGEEAFVTRPGTFVFTTFDPRISIP